ncbi:hypothetical protein TNCV_86311 [Trichonephila clavipes]|nr:hypothetical protein TNCV_86311 [Trichonephila clavipes]
MACLGHQSLSPTDLGRVDEEMASPGGRPLQIYLQYPPFGVWGIPNHWTISQILVLKCNSCFLLDEGHFAYFTLSSSIVSQFMVVLSKQRIWCLSICLPYYFGDQFSSAIKFSILVSSRIIVLRNSHKTWKIYIL